MCIGPQVQQQLNTPQSQRQGTSGFFANIINQRRSQQVPTSVANTVTGTRKPIPQGVAFSSLLGVAADTRQGVNRNLLAGR